MCDQNRSNQFDFSPTLSDLDIQQTGLTELLNLLAFVPGAINKNCHLTEHHSRVYPKVTEGAPGLPNWLAAT